jgi:hypothetical protein
MQSEQINELVTALAKAQGAMQNAVMNRINPHFKSRYADLASVLDAIRAPLSANGLSNTQTMQITEGGMILRTTLWHTSGQFISTEYPLPSTQKPHEMGSALTYARRYSLAALVCNSSDEDDDGNVAQDAPKTAGEKRKNPHVTRPEDISDHIHDVALPRDIGVEQISKAKANPTYKVLEKTLWECSSIEAMRTWSETNKEKISQLPDDWYLILRGTYAEHQKMIAEQDTSDTARMAANAK